MAKLSKKIRKRCSKSQMARFMARNSKWPENIFYDQRGANKTGPFGTFSICKKTSAKTYPPFFEDPPEG